MSANCGVCGGKCDDVKSLVKCAGACGNSFHILCIKPEGVKTRGIGKDWKCELCAPKKDASSASSGRSTTTAITKEFLISTLEAIKKEIFNELKAEMQIHSTQVQELKESVQFLSDSVDKSNSLIEAMRKEFSEIKKEVNELRDENKVLKKTVSNLQEKVRSFEQYSRRTNLEISGIPETPKEDVLSLIKDVGTAIGVELDESQVMAAHRIPSFKKNRTPSLIVQFHTKMQRDAWITNFRKKKTMSADEINRALPKNKVYLNEHLSPDSKMFLGQLKEACKKDNFKYVWFRDGKFYVRREDGGRCHRINDLSELSKLR